MPNTSKPSDKLNFNDKDIDFAAKIRMRSQMLM